MITKPRSLIACWAVLSLLATLTAVQAETAAPAWPCEPLRFLIPRDALKNGATQPWYTCVLWVAGMNNERVYVFIETAKALDARETPGSKQKAGWMRWDELPEEHKGKIDWPSLMKEQSNPNAKIYFTSPGKLVDVWHEGGKFHAMLPYLANPSALVLVFETLEHLRTVLKPSALRSVQGPPAATGLTDVVFGSEFARRDGVFARASDGAPGTTPREIVVARGQEWIWLPMPNGRTSDEVKKAFNIDAIEGLSEAAYRRLRSLARSQVELGGEVDSDRINLLYEAASRDFVDVKKALRPEALAFSIALNDVAPALWVPRNRFQELWCSPVPARRPKGRPDATGRPLVQIGPEEIGFETGSPPERSSLFDVEILPDSKTEGAQYYPRAIDTPWGARFVLIRGASPYFVQDTEMTVRQFAAWWASRNARHYADLNPAMIEEQLFSVQAATGADDTKGPAPVVPDVPGVNSSVIEKAVKNAKEIQAKATAANPRVEQLRDAWQSSAKLIASLARIDNANVEGWRSELVYLAEIIRQQIDPNDAKSDDSGPAGRQVLDAYRALTSIKLHRYLEVRAFKWVVFLSRTPSTSAAAAELAKRTGVDVVKSDQVRHLAKELFWESYFLPRYGKEAAGAAFEFALKHAGDGRICPLDEPVVFLTPDTAASLASSPDRDPTTLAAAALTLRLPCRADIAPLLEGVRELEMASPDAWSPYPRPARRTDVYLVSVGFPIHDLGGNVSEWLQETPSGKSEFALIGRNFHSQDFKKGPGNPQNEVRAGKHAFGEEIGFRFVLSFAQDEKKTDKQPAPATRPGQKDDGYNLSEAETRDLYRLLYPSSATIKDDRDQGWFKQRANVHQQLGESRYWDLMFLRQLVFAGYIENGEFLDSTTDSKTMGNLRRYLPEAFDKP